MINQPKAFQTIFGSIRQPNTAYHYWERSNGSRHFFEAGVGGCGGGGGGIRGLLRNTVLFYTEASGTQVGVSYFILSDNVQS